MHAHFAWPLCECEFGIDHHTGDYVRVGPLSSHREFIKYVRFWDGAFLSEKTGKSNRLQMSIETLRSWFFGISREPRTSRSYLTSALQSGLQSEGLRLTFVRLDHALEISDLPQDAGSLHPKTSQSHVCEKVLLCRTFSLINYRILFHRNVNIKTVSQLKYK